MRKRQNHLALLNALYKDAGRVALYGLMSGWRWHEVGLWFCREWELEETAVTATVITKKAVGDITACLAFTVENGEEFKHNWLPTLDMSLRVMANNVIQYRFSKKPTASSVCLQADA